MRVTPEFLEKLAAEYDGPSPVGTMATLAAGAAGGSVLGGAQALEQHRLERLQRPGLAGHLSRSNAEAMAARGYQTRGDQIASKRGMARGGKIGLGVAGGLVGARELARISGSRRGPEKTASDNRGPGAGTIAAGVGGGLLGTAGIAHGVRKYQDSKAAAETKKAARSKAVRRVLKGLGGVGLAGAGAAAAAGARKSALGKKVLARMKAGTSGQ